MDGWMERCCLIVVNVEKLNALLTMSKQSRTLLKIAVMHVVLLRPHDLCRYRPLCFASLSYWPPV